MKTQAAKKLLGCATDAELARALGVTRQAVRYWAGELPASRCWQIAMILLKKPAIKGGLKITKGVVQ